MAIIGGTYRPIQRPYSLTKPVESLFSVPLQNRFCYCSFFYSLALLCSFCKYIIIFFVLITLSIDYNSKKRLVKIKFFTLLWNWHTIGVKNNQSQSSSVKWKKIFRLLTRTPGGRVLIFFFVIYFFNLAMPKQEKKLTTKRTKRDKSEIDGSEYLRPVLSPTRVANEPNDDDPPSIEKHGFWMFPRKPQEKFAATGKKRSKVNYPCNDEEKPADRQNMLRMQQRCPPFRPMFPMGCQCFCHRPPCCPCRQWMNQPPAKYFGAMPIAKVQVKRKK